MELSVLQAAILALYYWFAQWYIFYSAINVFLGPLCTGLFCGIVLGDIPTAMKIAATIQPMFLAFTGAGGTVVWDETAATMGGCVITMISGLDTSQAVTIAVPLSLLCAQLHTCAVSSWYIRYSVLTSMPRPATPRAFCSWRSGGRPL